MNISCIQIQGCTSILNNLVTVDYTNGCNHSDNCSSSVEHNIDSPPTFTELSMIRTVLYGTIFCVSAIGNIATLIQMYRMRRRRSTINTLILNLALADLIVTFFCMLTDSVWTSTVQWLAGNFLCKAVRFIQTFGLYLSTYITVIISIDRCCVIVEPMSRNKAPKRVKCMIIVSWILCAFLSIPQALIFNVRRGPFKNDFYQCVDIGSYSEDWQQKLYSMSTLLVCFVVPLIIMGTSYVLIFCTISRNSQNFRESESSSTSSDNFRSQVRNSLLRKAKRKALRMSIVIVLAFIICWTPYYVIFTCFSFLYFEQINSKTMIWFFFFGMSNSVLNPMIYGAFHICKVHTPRFWKKRGWPNSSTKTQFTRHRTSTVHLEYHI